MNSDLQERLNAELTSCSTGSTRQAASRLDELRCGRDRTPEEQDLRELLAYAFHTWPEVEHYSQARAE